MRSDPVPPQIPEKLQRAGFRFIKILPGSKDPVEKGYTESKNYLASETEISTWLCHYHSFEWLSRDPDEREQGIKAHYEGYGNYGVLCSDTLIAIDLDRKDVIDAALSHTSLKGALSAQSGSGEGLHIWIRTSGAKTTKLSDPETNENVGHIKARGGYVVGPGCVHPSGGLYHIVNDGEIPEIPFEEILSIFSKYIDKRDVEPKKEEAKTSIKRYPSSTFIPLDIPVESIWYPTKPTKHGSEVQGAHPTHGSKGGSNFSINTVKNVWKCWRCNSGGGPAEAIAVKHQLIKCEDARKGCLQGGVYSQVLEIAEDEYGWVRPIKSAPAKPKILPDLPDEEQQFDLDIFSKPGIKTDRLPEELPDARAILADGYPRIGKSHWSELQAIKHKTANVIANTHSVIDQHLRIFGENKMAGQTAVHLEGRNRCCPSSGERRSCSGCPSYPYTNPSERGRFIAFADSSLHKYEILTKENVPRGVCPYFFLKEAARIADYVFTVPDNLEEITGEEHQPRHLTIIDEDTCFASFFPQSVDLAEFVFGPTRNYVVNLVEMRWIGIQKWKDYVTSGKRPKGKKTILRMIEILENIREILRIKDDVVFSPQDILQRISSVDLDIPEPEDISKPDLIRLIERWEIPDTFSPFVKALLYIYEERTLEWQGFNPMKLRLIANEETRIFDPPDTKMILIGSTRAEMFLKSLDVDYEAIRINKFQYSKNFIFFVVKNDSKKRKRPKTYQDVVLSTLKHVGRVNSTERYPLLVLTGTSKEQHGIVEELGGISKGSSDENIQGQRWNYIGGFQNVFYQNSVISRGVDIPFYKSLFVYSSDFANPYWTARYHVAIDNKDKDDIEYVESVMDAITVDETTNSTLRITPVVGHTDTTPRLVVISEKDLWKIKPGVLEEARVVEVDEDTLNATLDDVLSVLGKASMIPEREDIDEHGRRVVHWYVDTIFHEPEIIRGASVQAKSEYIERLVSPEGAKEKWRAMTTLPQIAKIEMRVMEILKDAHAKGRSGVPLGKVYEEISDRMPELHQTDLEGKEIFSRQPRGKKHHVHTEVTHGVVCDMIRRNMIRSTGAIGLSQTLMLLPSVVSVPIPDKNKNEI